MRKVAPYTPQEPCEYCDGIHLGSGPCPYRGPCVVCGEQTVFACADCGIDSAGRETVRVCTSSDCRDKHEATAHAGNGPTKAERA